MLFILLQHGCHYGTVPNDQLSFEDPIEIQGQEGNRDVLSSGEPHEMTDDPPLDSQSDIPGQSMETEDTITDAGETVVLTDPDEIGDESGSAVIREPIRLSVPMNAAISNKVKLYTHRRRRDFDESLIRGRKYLPAIQRELDKRGIPRELMWIPIIESGFKCDARSTSYAVGMWQLMPATARKFGLRIDDWVDERLDPERSTEAAMNALEYLYEKTGCWLLSLAAYNTGEGRVFRAMRDLETRDYWVIASHKRLPAQTRFYVAAVLAFEVIYHQQYEEPLNGAYNEWNSQFSVINLDHQADLKILADCAGISVDALRKINPALKWGWTPPDYPGYPLRIPQHCQDTFTENFQKIPRDKCLSWAFHKIVKGETLGSIASRYNSTVQQIMEVNHYSQTLIYAGKTLMVPVGLTFSD